MEIEIEDIKFSNLTQVLDEYCKEMKTYFGDQFQNSSDWLNTVQVEVNIDDKIVNIDIQVPDYYKYIENGRGPGKFPPIVKIQEWVERKKILPRPMINGKLPSQESLSFLIARHIAENGTEGKEVLLKTKEYINNIYRQKIQDAIQKDFENYFLQILAKINDILK